VVGCLIHLPQASTLPRQRPRLTLKSGQYLIIDPEQKRISNDGSFLAFFKNGQLQGVPFTEIGAEWFYPAISLFGDISVTANFGPNFEHPPSELPEGLSCFQPMSAAADDPVAQAHANPAPKEEGEECIEAAVADGEDAAAAEEEEGSAAMEVDGASSAGPSSLAPSAGP